MKKKFILFLFSLGAVLCGAVYLVFRYENRAEDILSYFGTENYSLSESLLIMAFSFPFSLIGKLLSCLSQTGKVGNGLAFALLAFIALIPLIPVLKTYKQKGKRLRNFILFLMCPLTAFVLLSFSDDSFIAQTLPAVSEELLITVRSVFGAAVLSGVISVFLIEFVVNAKKTGGTEMLKTAKKAAFAVAVFLVISVSIFETGKFFEKLEAVNGLAEGYMSILYLIKNVLHYILDIAVISSAVSLIDSVLENKTSDEISYWAHRLSKRCVAVLSAIITVSFLFNFIQIMLSPIVFSDVSVKIDIPVFSIAFVLMILFISKLVTENKKLKEDNDLFI